MVKGEIISYPLPEGQGAFHRPSQRSDNNELITLYPGGDLHDQWGLDLRRPVRRGRLGLPRPSSCLLGVLFGSQPFLVLRWSVLGTALGEVTSQCGFTWRLSLSMWGVNMDGLAYPLHRTMVGSC
jgi:hypothetical protein